MDSIHTELQLVFRKVFHDPSLIVDADATAADIQGWDSLTHMTLIHEIEQHFAIEFSFREVSSFKNVGDIIATLQRKLQ